MNNAVESAGARHRAQIEGTGPAGIVTDQFRAHHILRNIIENACKYAPADTSVRVTASGTEDAVVIEIVDQGPGVPEDQRSAVFERFKRGTSGDHIPSFGTGLGLYIAKRFIGELGGTIELDDGTDPPWTGARFTVVIPRSGGASREG